MRGWRSAKVSTIREEFDEINDSMKVSSSRMKNKVGAQKGAFIKMKQKNSHIYQRIYVVCYVPIIAPSFLVKSSSYYCSILLCSTLMCNFARCRCGKIVAKLIGQHLHHYAKQTTSL
ncbi:hypothetical protein D9I18_23570 [Escherichia coli]|nr:hypothetical protein [Escherichia coli]MGS94553.1 hypothetical protein [Escherichia coli]